MLFDLQVGHMYMNYDQILSFLFEKYTSLSLNTFLLLFIFAVLALNLGPCSAGQTLNSELHLQPCCFQTASCYESETGLKLWVLLRYLLRAGTTGHEPPCKLFSAHLHRCTHP